MESFYADSRACVRVGMDVSDWFRANVGLRQDCVMSPSLFNVYMDGVELKVWKRAGTAKCKWWQV